MSAHDPRIARIAGSGLFDAAWYVATYPDVALLAIDPAEHYLRYGGGLLRDPGPDFNTRQYLSLHRGVDPTRVNPLLHHLQATSGQKPPSHPALADSPSALIGYVSRLGESKLSGWAVDATRPGQPVELELRVDGEPMLAVKTGFHRADVDAAGLDGAAAGFSIAFPAGMFAAGAQVDMVFAGTTESLRGGPQIAKQSVRSPAGTFARYMDALRQGQVRPVTLVVPIFNAREAVAECIPAAMECLGPGVELLLIDDASTDPGIGALLEAYRQVPGVRVERNESNLGYTRTVNRGLALCAERDVVLLNSDTVATGSWLSRLRYCAYAFGKVATVTAISDNAGVFSVPVPAAMGHLQDADARRSYARAITQAGAGTQIDVPTGNGFCLYIRRDALDDIGGFDEARFPRGYGEENDFCMRGLRKGWRHLVSDKAYVFHKRSQSFLDEKEALIARATRILHDEYPEYRRLIARFNDLEFGMIRRRARHAVARIAQGAGRKRILYVISTQTGGTPQTNMDLMREVGADHECFLLSCDASMLKLSRLVGGELQEVESFALRDRIDPLRHCSDQYDNYVADLLYRHAIDLLHVRHIAWHSLGLFEAARAMSVPTVYSIHDFYALCPTVKLLDQDRKFCGGVCTPGEGACRIELWRQEEIPNLKHRFIRRWRELQGSHLDGVDAFVTTSDFVADMFVGAFPSISRDRFSVIPHGRDFPGFTPARNALPGEGKLRVLVLGNIAAAKGARLIKAMSEQDADGALEFHFLGNVAPELHGVGIQHGKYDREDVIRKIGEIDPHVGVILSVWPETYCHTLTELWASGIPVLGMEIGAVGERIAASGAGWLISHEASAGEVAEALVNLRDDVSGYAQRLEAVDRWQRTEGLSGSCARMAAQYVRIYDRIAGNGPAELAT